MKVRMKSLAAGPAGVFQVGQVVEVSEEEGALLVPRYADAVDTPAEAEPEPEKEEKVVEVSEEEGAETATAPSPPDRAVRPKAKRR